MRTSFVVGLTIVCALFALIIYKFAPRTPMNNGVPVTNEQTAEASTPTALENQMMTNETTMDVAANSNSSNANGLVTLQLNTKFNTAKPSPEEAKAAFAMNAKLNQTNGQ